MSAATPAFEDAGGIGSASPAAPPGSAPGVGLGLLLILALQCAVPPFATDMYTPAFPEVQKGLGTTAGLLGMTLTAFFVGMATGQLTGGPVSDRVGRRTPLILGGLVCTLGGIVCMLTPNIGVLILARLVQGFGGGLAAAVARAVVVDRSRGPELARAMSLLMALTGLAPMIAPVVGALVLTATSWRGVFGALVALGALMALTSAFGVRESLAPERRHSGGLRALLGNAGAVLRDRAFVAWVVTGAMSGFAMMAYIADAPYVLQGINGLGALPYAIFFASTAGTQIVVTVISSRLVGAERVAPERLVRLGLVIACGAVMLLAVSVFALGTPLVLTGIGFLLLMSVQGMVFGNSSALAAARATHIAGTASAIQGVFQAAAMATSAPLASSGGTATAVPMVLVMIVGLLVSLLAFSRTGSRRRAV